MIRHSLCGLMFILGTFALAFAQPANAQQPTATHQVFLPFVTGGSAAALTAEEQVVLDSINQARALRAASDGTTCPALRVSPQLQIAARAQSADMAARNFFGHTNPDGITPFGRATAAGYVGSQVAENIAAGQTNAAAAVASWLNSAAHRTTLLDCSLTETGIGYIHEANDQANVMRSNGSLGGPYFDYWTQLFGTP